MITFTKNTQAYKRLCLANLVEILAPPLAKTTPNVDALSPRCLSLKEIPRLLNFTRNPAPVDNTAVQTTFATSLRRTLKKRGTAGGTKQ